MKKALTKVLSLVLTLAMLLQILPPNLFAYAGGTTPRTLKFGQYPTEEVTRDETITALNSLEMASRHRWKSYGYYVNSMKDDFMQYIDVSYNGSKYRGVKFSSRRPGSIDAAFPGESDEYEFSTGDIHWFKYTDVIWYVLKENSDGSKILLAQDVLDAQSFSARFGYEIIAGEQIAPNHFDSCELNAWLNDWTSVAFSSEQQDMIDSVGLLSLDQFQSWSESLSYTGSTAYAQIQGYDSAWWLSTPGSGNDRVQTVTGGTVSEASVKTTSVGVRPCLTVNKTFGKPISSGVSVVTPAVGGSDSSESVFQTNELQYVSLQQGESYAPSNSLSQFSGVYQIYTIQDLLAFAEKVNNGELSGANFRLEKNLDLGGRAWTPAGTENHPFTGTFDGQSHEIKNFTLTPTDGEKYCGFFGLIQNGYVHHLGIADYRLAHGCSLSTEIGAFAAKITGTTKLLSCFANGEIATDYALPKDVRTIKKASDVPTSVSSTSIINLVLDFSACTSTQLNKTITVSGKISGLTLIGKANTTFSGLQINVTAPSYTVDGTSRKAEFYITLQNFKATDSNLSVTNAANVFIRNLGENSIQAKAGTVAITSDSPLYVLEGKLTVVGGNGANGAAGTDNATDEAKKNGKDGQPGSAAIQCTKLTCYHTDLTARGGNGGNGGAGGKGKDGENGRDGEAGWSSGHDGYNGENGGVGGSGGDGGAGGVGVLSYGTNIVCYNSQLYFVSGNGGNGGNGGDGGDGGKGGNGGIIDNKNTWIVSDYYVGINGGKGGDYGAGGDGGKSASCVFPIENEVIVYSGLAIAESGSEGYPGEQGAPGNAGLGGNLGYVSNMKTGVWPWLNYWTRYGNPGVDGASFEESENVRPGSPPPSSTGTGTVRFKKNVTNDDFQLPRLFFGPFVLSGFVGSAGQGTEINSCTAFTSGVRGILNNSATLQLGNDSFSRTFLVTSQGTVTNCLSTKFENGKYQSYPADESGLADSQRSGATLLSVKEETVRLSNGQTQIKKHYYDDTGVGYDGAVLSLHGEALGHALSEYRYVIEHDAAKTLGNVVLPTFVYSGKYITKVAGISTHRDADDNIVGAFQDCTTIKSIDLSENVKALGDDRAFTLGRQAFMRSSIESANLSGIKAINEETFCNCESLTSVTFGDSLESLAGTEVNVLSGGVISYAAFYGCKALKSFTLPESVTSIGAGLLEGCTALKALSLPFLGTKADAPRPFKELFLYLGGSGLPTDLQVTLGKNASPADYDMAEEAFKDCGFVKSVTLKKSVRSIGAFAFYNCTNLSSVSLADGLEKIGDKAFLNCTSLSGTFTIPNTVKTIGTQILEGCTKILTIHLGASLEINSALAFYMKSSDYALNAYEVDGNNAKLCAENGILYKCVTALNGKKAKVAVVDVPVKKNLQHTNGYFTLPSTVIAILDSAFAYNQSLKKIKLENVREIGFKAFFNCEALTDVVFQATATDIYENGKLKQIKLTEETTISAIEIDFNIGVESYAFASCTSLKTINLDSPFIRKIGDYAFSGCSKDGNVETITLGSGLEFLSSTAFDATRLEKFLVNQGNQDFVAKDGVLFRKEGQGLTLLICPNYLSGLKQPFNYTVPNTVGKLPVTSIDDHAFEGQWTIKGTVSMGSNVTLIGDDAFLKAELSRVVIGKGVDTISNTAFSNCSKLESIQVDPQNGAYSNFRDDGVLYNKDLTMLMFYPAAKPDEEYRLPETLELITSFSSTSIKTITVTSESIEFESNAFVNCPNLKDLYFVNTLPPTCGSQVFALNNYSMITFHYPLHLKEAWLSDGRTQMVDEELALYSFAPSRFYKNRVVSLTSFFELPSKPKLSEDYYSIFVTDNAGNYLDNVVVKLSATYNKGESYTDDRGNTINHSKAKTYVDSSLTAEGVKSVTNLYDNFPIDYSHPYQLIVQDNNGGFFPYVNDNFYLDRELGFSYVVLNKVASVTGVSVQYQNKAIDKLNHYYTADGSHEFESVKYTFARWSDLFNGTNSSVVITEDINTEQSTINKWAIESVKLNVNCDMEASDTVIGVAVLQGNNSQKDEAQGTTKKNEVKEEIADFQKKTNTASELEVGYYDIEYVDGNSDADGMVKAGKKLGRICLNMDTADLRSEQNVYVRVRIQPASGEAYSIVQKMNVKVINMDYTNVLDQIDLSFITSDFKIHVADNVPLIGGTEIDIGGKEMKQKLQKLFPFHIEIGADFVKVVIQSDDWSNTLGEKKLTSTEAAKICLEENLKEFEESGSLKSFVGGYASFKYKGIKANGQPRFDVNCDIYVGMKCNFSVGTTVPTVFFVPLRLELDFNGKGQLEFGLKYDNDFANSIFDFFSALSLERRLVGQISVTAHVGLGCSILSVGLYGSLTLNFVFGIIPKTEVKKLNLVGDVGVYIKFRALFITIERRFSFFSNDAAKRYIIIDKDYPELQGQWIDANQSLDPLDTRALFNQANYTVKKTGLLTSVGAKGAASPTDESDPLDAVIGAYGYSDIRIVQAGGKTYLIYQDNVCREDYFDTARGQYTWYGNDGKDYDELNYQKIVYREIFADGTLSDEVHILDDNGLADGEFDTYYDAQTEKLYVLYAQLNSKLEEQFDVSNVSNYVSRHDVKVAVLNKNSQVESFEQLTFDGKYDLNLRLNKINGKLTAVWEKTDYSDMFAADAEGDDLTNSIYCSVLENGNWSTRLVSADVGTIADLEIADDRIAYLVDADNDLSGTMDEETWQSVFDRIIVTSDLNGNKSYPLSTAVGSYASLSSLNGDLVYYSNGAIFKVNGNKEIIRGEEIAVPEEFQELRGQNGETIAILFTVATADSSGVYAVYYNAADGVWGQPVEMASFKDATVNAFGSASLSGSKLMLAVAENRGDVTVLENAQIIQMRAEPVIGKADIDYSSVQPGSDAFVICSIQNPSGEVLTAADLLSLVSVKTGTKAHSIRQAVFCDIEGEPAKVQKLYSGQKGYVKITFDAGDPTAEETRLYVNDTLCASFKLWYSDFAVTARLIRIGDSYYVIYKVRNDGYLPGCYTLSLEGTDYSCEYSLAPEESIMARVLLTRVETYSEKISVNADDEYVTSNNSVTIAVSTDSPAIYNELDSLFEELNGMDLSMYTESSVTALNAVIGSIDHNLSAVDQPTVDAYVESLNEAILSLELAEANYSEVSALLMNVQGKDLSIYTGGSVAALNAVIDGIDFNLTADHQATVDAYRDSLSAAIDALEYRPADYTALNALLHEIGEMDLSPYTAESRAAVGTVISCIRYDLTVVDQATVDAWTDALQAAVLALEFDFADYSEVNTLLDEIQGMRIYLYMPKSVERLNEVINGIVFGLTIDQQATVDCYRDSLSEALAQLELIIWGDANGDGKVDNKDIIRLKSYLANYDQETGTSTVEIGPGADANGDGVIDNKDIVRLKNYFANYNDETGISTNGSTVYVLGPAAVH